MQAWASASLQYSAEGSMARANLTNATGSFVDLPLRNGIDPTLTSPLPTVCQLVLFSSNLGTSVVGDVYVVAAALTTAVAASSLSITASVVENGVDSGAQRDAASKVFRQPPRAGRAVPAAAAMTALAMGQNFTAVVTKGAYAYWSLDVTPGYELRCSLQVSSDALLYFLPKLRFIFFYDALQVSAEGAYVALLAASRQLPVVTNPASYSWSYDVTAAAATSLHVPQSDVKYRSGPHTLAAHASLSGVSSRSYVS